MPLQYAALRETVAIDARGADAAEFLHGQLTAAVRELDSAHAPLAAWADARGRVRALFRVCRLPDRWLLLTPRDGADQLVRKLRMFVLRAKVTVGLADDVEVAALLGHDDEVLARNGVAAGTELDAMAIGAGPCFVRVGDAYWLALGRPKVLAELGASLAATTEAAAAVMEIKLGIPSIVASTSERFVAQMLNLDELDAVSFNKGCYPGQEIIARVHNLGGVKRRARRYALRAAPPEPASIVLAGEQAVGEVVRAAATDNGCELLAVVDHAAAGGPLTCAGAALVELPLPFAVPLR